MIETLEEFINTRISGQDEPKVGITLFIGSWILSGVVRQLTSKGWFVLEDGRMFRPMHANYIGEVVVRLDNVDAYKPGQTIGFDEVDKKGNFIERNEGQS